MNIMPHKRGMYVVTMHESNVATIGRDRLKAWQQAVNEYWHYRNAAQPCSVTPIHHNRSGQS